MSLEQAPQRTNGYAIATGSLSQASSSLAIALVGVALVFLLLVLAAI